MHGTRPGSSLLRDRQGLSTLEYSVLFIMLCAGTLVVWTKLSGSFRCNLERAQAQFVSRLSGEPVDPLQVACGSSASGPAGLSWPGTGAGSAPQGSAASGTARVEGPTARAPGGSSSTGTATGKWVQDILKVMCPQDKAFLQQLRARGVQITAYDRIYFDDPYYDGTQWTTKRFEAGGTTNGNKINMIRTGDPAEDASIIYHEGVHTGQPSSLAWRDQEYEAYIKEDAWRLSRGMPASHPKFRKKDASGKEVTDAAAIRRFVDKKYPGVSAKGSGPAPDQIVDRKPNGDTELMRADGTTYTRKPQKGDSYAAASSVTVPKGGIPIDMASLQCP